MLRHKTHKTRPLIEMEDEGLRDGNRMYISHTLVRCKDGEEGNEIVGKRLLVLSLQSGGKPALGVLRVRVTQIDEVLQAPSASISFVKRRALTCGAKFNQERKYVVRIK